MKRWSVGLIAAALISTFSLVTPLAAVSAQLPATQFAAPCPGVRILTFPNWYDNIEGFVAPNGSCTVQFRSLNDIWVVVLNVLEAVIQATGYIATGFIIWGGIKYVKSQGDPNQINQSRDTIVNASIGLIIVLGSVAIVRFIAMAIADGQLP